MPGLIDGPDPDQELRDWIQAEFPFIYGEPERPVYSKGSPMLPMMATVVLIACGCVLAIAGPLWIAAADAVAALVCAVIAVKVAWRGHHG